MPSAPPPPTEPPAPPIKWYATPRVRALAGFAGAWLLVQGVAAFAVGGATGRGPASEIVIGAALLWWAFKGRLPGRVK